MLDVFLRLSPLQAITHPSADPTQCCWTSSSAVPFSDGHPSHCRPNPVLLNLFLRLSPLQAITHPSADLDRQGWRIRGFEGARAPPGRAGDPLKCTLSK